MEYFEKKITYLRGLCDGSDFPAESKEGKISMGFWMFWMTWLSCWKPSWMMRTS